MRSLPWGAGLQARPGRSRRPMAWKAPQGRQAGADGTQLGPCEVRQKLQERFTTKIGQATNLLSYAFLHEHSRNEQDLVNALGFALKHAEKTLLEAVRRIALEHQLRRESILKEMHSLASRMGALPQAQLPDGSLEDTHLELGECDPVGQSAP